MFAALTLALSLAMALARAMAMALAMAMEKFRFVLFRHSTICQRPGPLWRICKQDLIPRSDISCPESNVIENKVQVGLVTPDSLEFRDLIEKCRAA